MAEGRSYWENQNFERPMYNTKAHLIVRLQSWILGDVEYLFIAITLRSSLTLSDRTSSSPMYRSNRTVQSFNKAYCY